MDGKQIRSKVVTEAVGHKQRFPFFSDSLWSAQDYFFLSATVTYNVKNQTDVLLFFDNYITLARFPVG